MVTVFGRDARLIQTSFDGLGNAGTEVLHRYLDTWLALISNVIASANGDTTPLRHRFSGVLDQVHENLF